MIPRGHNSERQRNNKFVIHISGFKPKTKPEDLIAGLRSFGEIMSCKIHRNSEAFLTFKSRISVEKMLQYPYTITLNGRNLKITRAKCRFSKSTPNVLKIPEDLITSESQIHHIISKTLLDKADHQECQKIIAILGEQLTFFGRLVPFGSFLAELACKKCDIDVTLIRDGMDFFDEATKFLRDSNIFRNIVAIKYARMPILTFRLRKFPSTNIDLSFNNKMGILNSQLFALYVKYSREFRDASVLIRQWFKQPQFKSVFMNSYIVNLMILIPLFHPNLPSSVGRSFPTPSELLEIAEETIVVDGWLCGVPSLDKLVAVRGPSDLSTMDMISAFFGFWSGQNFDKVFLSSNGFVVPWDAFCRDLSGSLGDKTAGEFTLSRICIQDPYIKTFNVSYMISDDAADLIIDEIRRVSFLFEDCEYSSIRPLFA